VGNRFRAILALDDLWEARTNLLDEMRARAA